MLELLIEKVQDTRFLAMIFAAVAAAATVITLAMPLLSTDALAKRMKAVAVERERLRQRERERLARGEKISLRQSAVDRFNLTKLLGQESAREKLVQAGYRGQAPYVAYLFFRMVTPIVTLVLSLLYLFVILNIDQPPVVKLGICIFATYIGMQLP